MSAKPQLGYSPMAMFRSNSSWRKNKNTVKINDNDFHLDAHQHDTHELSMTLADLQYGISSLITGINTEHSNQNRLFQLGVIPGAQASVLRSAPFGDPIQVQIEGTLLSIRRRDAENIQVEHA